MYAPLKVTTDYTILKSLIKIDDLMAFLKNNKITACAICDENLYGVFEFYNKCLENAIKPIIGLTVEINNLPIYLYARNYEGYRNLLKIHTLVHKNELTASFLQKYSSCLVGILPVESKSLYEILSFMAILYVGYKNKEEKRIASLFCDKTIFVNDLRALQIEDLKYLEYLDQLRKEPSRDYSYNYYLKNSDVKGEELEEFISLFDFTIPEGKNYIPKYNTKIDSYQFLSTLAHKGLEKRLGGTLSEKYLYRLNYELKIIKKLGFVDYFLIVYDYVLYAKKHSILVGPGRGSAAGSLVSFSIGITEIDPLKYDLLFERFLNPGRVTMPDIDIDFDASKRDLVIEYVKNKYGRENVAPGITFNTLKSKLVLREVGKLCNVNVSLLDKFVRNIDGADTLKKNLENETIKTYISHYKELENVYKIAMKLEGIKKNVSTHAAGVVISSCPLDEVIPTYWSNETYLTGVAMEYLEKMGLLKMDFLGLKNLTVIANILRQVGDNKLDQLNLEDEQVYHLLSSGKTEGIFQFETPLMQNLLIKLNPRCFNDLIAAVALGRPGPKDHVESFIKRKNNKEQVVYLHPDLIPILKDTYGIMLYQEQIISVLVKFAGYSYSEADIIRRAISKKKESVILAQEKDFISKCISRGYEKSIAIQLYAEIKKFASYGFNKAHSVSYALIAYQIAYLKVYYPAYFVVELLNTSSGSKNEMYLSYLKQMGIKFYKPSVNNPSIDYEIKENKLIMPLSIIKNISLDISTKIRQVKKENYIDYFDFVLKTKEFITPAILETLIKAGALDSLGVNRQTMINNIDLVLNYASLVGEDDSLIPRPSLVEYPEYSNDVLRNDELVSFGFYITNHPASKYIGGEYIKTTEVEKYLFKKVTMVCLLESIKVIKTKKGEEMAFFVGSDEFGRIDFTVFPNYYEKIKNIAPKTLIKVRGEATKRFDKIGIIVNNISILEG